MCYNVIFLTKDVYIVTLNYHEIVSKILYHSRIHYVLANVGFLKRRGSIRKAHSHGENAIKIDFN